MKKVLQFVNSATSDFDAFATNGRYSQKFIFDSIKYIKSLLLLITFVSFMGFNNANAAGGIYDGWLIFKGTTFNLGSQAVALNGYNLGTFVYGGDASITYTEADMFKDADGNNCSAELWYKITGTGSTSYTGSDVNTGAMGYDIPLGGNNYKWKLNSISNANILAGLSAGTYQIAFWIHGTGSTSNSLSCSDNFYYSNNSNNYVATFTIVNSSVTDYYRSKNTGNWNTAANWESSPNNSSWGPSSLIPGSAALGITILSGHNITLDANVTIQGLTINSGGTITASDATAKNLTITKSTSGSTTTLLNSGTWSNGTGGSTVIFTGAPSGSDAIHAITGTIAFQNITVNKTGGTSNVGVSFGANSSVSGTLEIGSGGFVSTAPPVSFYGTSAILKFNQGTGATYNVGSGDFTWSTTQVPNNISISSGTVSLNNARTATGNLLIDGGTLSLSAQLTIQGNWTRSSGTFTPNSQTVTLSGGANTIINTTTDATLYDLVVNKTGSATVSLSSNLTVSHNLTISGGVLTVPSTRTLTVSGVLSNSVASGIVLESPSYSEAPGSLITNGTVSFTGSGSLKAERYIPAYTGNANGWHLISSPVISPSLSSTNLTPGTNDDFYKWNETQNLWLNQKVGGNNITSMITGTGYLVAYASASPTKYMTGTPNNSDVSYSNFTITPATPVELRGWHVVGNPYPCAITWNPAGNSYALLGIEGTAKIMGNAGGYTDVSAGGIIPAMQGFSVLATNTTNSFTIPKSARTHNAAIGWSKSSENNSILITANDLESQMVQESWVRVNDQATEGYDQEYDSHFLPFYAPKFYSKAGDEMFSTNSLPSIPAETVMPFGFEKNNATNFSIELKQSIEGLPVYLTDLKTNTDQNLSENPVYTFTSEAGDDPNRFLLHFLNTTGTNKPLSSTIKVYSAPGKINISGVDGKAEILIRNMMGQVVMRNSVNGSTLQSLNTNKLPAGVYVVSVVSASKTVSRKIVVK